MLGINELNTCYCNNFQVTTFNQCFYIIFSNIMNYSYKNIVVVLGICDKDKEQMASQNVLDNKINDTINITK